MNALAPMITIKLSTSNYIYWHKQILPLLSHQHLLSHVDGSLPIPPQMIQSNDKQVINPEYTTWLQEEQQAIIILNASLTEEALAVTVGFSSARDIWVALEAAFCNTSVERVQNLRDNLRALKKGDKSVADFGRQFKSICYQLHAVGHPVDSMDQLHWFLFGLGKTFESFSTTVWSSRPIPNFVDLLASAESHELFVKNLSYDGTPPIVAFSAQTDKNAQQAQRNSFSNRSRQSHKNSYFEQAQPFSGRSNRPNRGAFSQTFGRGPGQSPRSFFGQPRGLNRGQFQSAFGPPFYPISSPPICQLCGKTGHLASQCWHLASFAASASPSDEQMAQAFHAHCNLSPSVPDWTSDTGASTHMLPNTTPLQNSSPVSGSSNEANNSAGMP
ncbi:putative transcription factor interactor and regulator CCHC(Zn) family [Helianthus annuus]|nr:putative transcription factor interactor and regulator CCHC(Zn) family [Helianthus annuus]